MINFTSDRDFVSKLKHTIEIKFAKLALLGIHFLEKWGTKHFQCLLWKIDNISNDLGLWTI